MPSQTANPTGSSLQEEPVRGHVFVIDDDGAVCEALAVLAESAAYAARRFTSGGDFLAALDTLPPGCAVVDVTMPVVDGPAVLAA